jgi:hypothetical protein
MDAFVWFTAGDGFEILVLMAIAAATERGDAAVGTYVDAG